MPLVPLVFSPTIAAAAETMPRIRVDNTFGAGLIGAFAASVMYGITCLQTATFLRRKERTWIRNMVVFLWVCDTFHLVAICAALYFYLITNYANPAALFEQELWTTSGYYLTTGLMEFTIRGMFTYRVWKLSERNRLLTALIVATSLINWVGNLMFAGKNMTIKTFPNLSSIAWTFYMAFGASVVADVLTAVSLWFLLKGRRTGFKKTDSLLKILMVYSVNTGAISSLCALLVLILYCATPNTFLYVPFYFLLPKIMLNSLLATLNASKRHWERTQGTTSGIISIPMSPVNLATPRSEQGDSKHMAQVDLLQGASRRHVPTLVIDTQKAGSDEKNQDSQSMDSAFSTPNKAAQEHVLDLKYAAA